MGYGTRTPTTNDPPRQLAGKSPYLEENELMDEVALLFGGDAKRCGECGLAVRTKYLNAGLCPDCSDFV